VPLNKRALNASHYVFPPERVGVATDDRIPAVFDTKPEPPIGSWKVAWTTAREKASVTCRFHDLRHATMARLLERGVEFAVVATVLGWSPATSVRMARRYGHIGPSAQREAMARLTAERRDPRIRRRCGSGGRGVRRDGQLRAHRDVNDPV
jgi:integrase